MKKTKKRKNARKSRTKENGYGKKGTKRKK